ncbi:hypothetical protein [Undibacterium sp. JH2W]|uniref:hypothetical protein n=1 Tax=Undibacterium sp. JH2W TaxID=3413037 RepID=UPI003BF5538A
MELALESINKFEEFSTLAFAMQTSRIVQPSQIRNSKSEINWQKIHFRFMQAFDFSEEFPFIRANLTAFRYNSAHERSA